MFQHLSEKYEFKSCGTSSLIIQAGEQIVKLGLGRRKFEIDKYELYRLISNEKIIKIKNKTKISYDLNKLANENTLKGLGLEPVEINSDWLGTRYGYIYDPDGLPIELHE